MLKPSLGDERAQVANSLMAGLLATADQKAWPTVGDTVDLPAKPRRVRKAQERMNSPEQKPVDPSWIEEKEGEDQKVVSGLAGQWRTLDGARFVPAQGDRNILITELDTLCKQGQGAVYERLKNMIVSCRYVYCPRQGFPPHHQIENNCDVAKDDRPRFTVRPRHQGDAGLEKRGSTLLGIVLECRGRIAVPVDGPQRRRRNIRAACEDRI